MGIIFMLKSLCLFFSFGMTENYFVFLEQPMYVNVMRLLVNKLCGQPMAKDIIKHDSEKVNDIEKNMNDLLHKTCSWIYRGYLFI